MKIEATNIRVSGTVAEFRRIADALAITDPSTSQYIRADLIKRDRGGDAVYDDDGCNVIEWPDDHEIAVGFGTRQATTAVMKAIDTLHLVPADAT